MWYQGQYERDVLIEPPTNIHGVQIPYFACGDTDRFQVVTKNFDRQTMDDITQILYPVQVRQ